MERIAVLRTVTSVAVVALVMSAGALGAQASQPSAALNQGAVPDQATTPAGGHLTWHASDSDGNNSAANVDKRGDVSNLRCKGRKATVKAHKGLIVGTQKADVIVATGRSRIVALGGNDLICGSRFADVIDAGAGHDTVFAGQGNDRISGGPGRDRIFGEGGNDRLNGGKHVDQLYGGPGKNLYNGHRANTKTRSTTSDIIDDNDNVVDISLGVYGFANIYNNQQAVSVFRPTTGPAQALPTVWQTLPAYAQNVISWEGNYSAFAGVGDQVQPGQEVFLENAQPIALGQAASYVNDALSVAAGSSPAGFGFTYQAIFDAPATMGLGQSAAINGQPVPASPLVGFTIQSGQQAVVTPSNSIVIRVTPAQLPSGAAVLSEVLSDPQSLPANGATLTLQYNTASGAFDVVS